MPTHDAVDPRKRYDERFAAFVAEFKPHVELLVGLEEGTVTLDEFVERVEAALGRRLEGLDAHCLFRLVREVLGVEPRRMPSRQFRTATAPAETRVAGQSWTTKAPPCSARPRLRSARPRGRRVTRRARSRSPARSSAADESEPAWSRLTPLQRAQHHLLAALDAVRDDERAHGVFVDLLCIRGAREAARLLDREERPS